MSLSITSYLGTINVGDIITFKNYPKHGVNRLNVVAVNGNQAELDISEIGLNRKARRMKRTKARA